MERVGLRASPQATLKALEEALRGVRLQEAKVYLITDWQDRRDQARYAVLVHTPKKDVLSLDAFGPAFPGGEEALARLLDFLRSQGASRFYEAVLPRSALYTLFEREDQEVLRAVMASANPADPGLYVPQA
ncbi:DUF3197 domain-containing protein [Thermus filiformis]|uniref:Uncharacterized protein n=1 Tax=Thermus filiformis TaxID=276 RepID=A0A0A2WR41_THEFI|nr:DUF3197 domain-containing protein [Thermus filiformis]KGQ22283.1 hypothetical protein THFILI_03405 [Thermus filiformis]